MPRGRKRRDSFALVMVLVALAVMSVLLLALFGGASHQARDAQGDASAAREKMLGDTVAALVIGQIQQATTQPGQAWISQPGLLRTYAATSARTPAACYKLYSSTRMIDTSGSLAFVAGDVPGDWNSTANAGVYTDLNAPMQTLGGASIYPILDARAIQTVTVNGATVNEVEGVSSDAGHAVEMPVAWLYELQDGTLGSPGAATAANPIVGRVAFWTDDETSKIDINTAGEASPWNTPRSSSTDDLAWATTQPAAGEFSRYPGHPASVSLSTVFGTNTTIGLTPDQLLALTPRYATGGSDFGANPTTATSSVPPKTDRLYATLDELCFGATLDASGQRVPGAITPDEVNLTRFVLTAHSHAPETTLLGEPRISIWPVSDAPNDTTKTTADDRALAADATVGSTSYYFQRDSATSPQNDLNLAGNMALFTNLVASGGETLPGYGTNFAQKYPGAAWPQIVLEILDAIRGFNAIDPAAPPLGSAASSSSFVPFAAGDSTGVGRGLIEPLSVTYQGTPLRGIGRYPTLFGLTLVFYVSGFGFTDGTSIDYETAPDDLNGTSWQANFTATRSPGSRWKQVNSALVRAFVVPTTFQPGCGFPEVSDGCTIRISGLNGLTATSNHATGSFGFPAQAISRSLSDALAVPNADRAWGGFEGPLAWRAGALDAANGGAYAFAGTQAFAVPLATGAAVDSKTGGPSFPGSWVQTLSVAALPGVTVQMCDPAGQVVQTCTVNLPAFSAHTPTVNGEADHYDGSTPATSHADWATNPACRVYPSYYMTLKNRLLATQLSRPLMIQAGDMSLSVEAKTDLRTMAAMAGVPALCYGASTTSTTATAQGGTHQHNLYFADGTSACWVTPQTVKLAGYAYADATTNITVVDWRDGTTAISYPWATSPPCSAPTGTSYVTMKSPDGTVAGPAGDWDTGPGFEPDGALINLPDAGTSLAPATAYESLSGGQFGAATLRSPNALIPSPVVFGSLPAGINPANPAASQPWRTLLFCPYPSADQLHPGLASPPDYLLLDRFWMPVIEPYGISTCLETAGKINLNDPIVPFTYLHRNTALRALLHGVRLPAISPADAASYKTLTTPPPATIWNTIDEDATIQQIENRFATGDAYLTEGEICSVPLVPTGVAAGTLESYWTSPTGAGFLTGDNLRELPYAQLYSRLTTKSNSYTVHLRVQVLQKLNDHSNPAVWREGTDRVLGDWRGSYEIERYLDPAAAAPAAGQPFPASAWKFRIVSAKRFTP